MIDTTLFGTSCDTMVSLGTASAGGRTIFGKNSDRPVREAQPLELCPRGAEATTRMQFVTVKGGGPAYRHVGSRPYWCRGYEHGFNEHQVVIGNEAMPSRLPKATSLRLVGMEILRMGLERAGTAAEAVEVITGAISEYGQGEFANPAGVRTYDNIYLVADPGEAYVIEAAGHEWAVKRATGITTISNVGMLGTDADAVSAGAESQAVRQDLHDPGAGAPFSFAGAYSDVASARSGIQRQARSSALLAARAGRIDAETIMRTLGDHGSVADSPDAFQRAVGERRGICTHPAGEAGGTTAASLVADLCGDGSRLPVYWCGLYSPCMTLWNPVFIEGDLPPVLGIGGEEPSAESPWWTFYGLTQHGLRGGPGAAEAVRSAWAPLQAELLESAYEMAARGRALIDDGERASASEMLTGYMAENTARMLAKARGMLAASGAGVA